MIRVEDLSIGYGGQELVGRISFELGPGDLLLLLGPNGSGKTTLLRTILGAVPKLAGSMTFEGKELGGMKAEDVAKCMAFVPQDEVAPFEFTAREMVCMGRMVRSGWWADTPEDRVIVESAMVDQSCLQYADRSISQLSGGERQRVYLARALAQESPLWLFDEPNSHLDIRYQLELERTILRGVENGKAVVASVHDLQMAQRLKAPALIIIGNRALGPSSLKTLALEGSLEKAFGVPFGLSAAGVVELAPGH